MKKLVLLFSAMALVMLSGCGGPVTNDEAQAASSVESASGTVSVYRKGNTIFSNATYPSAFDYVVKAVDIYGYKTVAADKNSGYVKALPGKTSPLSSVDQPVTEINLTDMKLDGIKAEVKVSVNGKFDKAMSEMVAEKMVRRYIEIMNQLAARDNK